MPQSMMQTLTTSSDSHRNSAFRILGGHFSISLPSPLPILLDSLSAFIRGRSLYASRVSSALLLPSANTPTEVEIRIIGEQEQANIVSDHLQAHPLVSALPGDDGIASPAENPHAVSNEGFGVSEPSADDVSRQPAAQRYDFQALSRWIEQVLPFAVLLLMVFIREHLQGLVVISTSTAVMIKANEILRKQAALKGERKTLILGGIGVVLVAHIVTVYWWFKKDAFWLPLLLHLPRAIPRFWEAVFIIVLNDTLTRQAFMIVKCGLLLSYKNSRGRDYRRQAQLLTLVEHFLLLYRALIPGPVWYRFFLNKVYGNLFSPLTTGLYLTFKLTSILEKVKIFVLVLRAVSGKVQFGAYATTEEVLAAGDLCAICQGKMHTPITLSCKHLFCEDCVSEWFERERTCPLCRAVVKSAGLRSFGDGSTCLFVQIF